MAEQYLVTDVSAEVNEDWQLSLYAAMVRGAVLSAISIPWDLVTKTLSPDTSDGEYAFIQELITSQLGLLIPAVLGLLAAILVPVIAFLYFCCYCCGNCGGHLTVRDVRSHSATCQIINGIIVLSMAAILLAMCGCVPISGERLGDSPRVILHSLSYSLDDFFTFANNFVKNGSDIILTQVNSTLDVIKTEITDLPTILTDSLQENGDAHFADIDTQASLLSQGLDNLQTKEVQINASIDVIITAASTLENGLNFLHTNLTLLKTQCTTDGESFCGLLLGGSTDPVSINISQLTSAASMIHDYVQTVSSLGIVDMLTISNTTFAALPDTIHNASSEALSAVTDLLDGVPAEVEPMITELIESINLNSSELGLDEFFEGPEDIVDTFETMRDAYLSTVLLVMSAVLGSIPSFAVLGLLLGCLCTGDRPGSNIFSHNRTALGHCGARCLMLSVVITFLVIMYILLFGSVLLFVGGNLTVVCDSLQDLSAIEKLIDSGVVLDLEALAELLLNNNVTISITHLMQTCRDGGTLYSGLNLEQILDLNSLFNVSEFVPDFGAELNSTVNTTLQGISLFPEGDITTLTADLVTPNVTAVEYTNQVLNDLQQLDLGSLADNLTTIRGLLTDQSYKDSYNFLAQQAASLNAHMSALEENITALGTMFDELNGIGNSMKLASTDFVTALNSLLSFIENEAFSVFIEATQSFMDKMLQVPTDLINTITDLLKTSIGNCGVIGTIYDTIVGSFCIHFLDTFNVLWAALYVGGITMVVLMIASCKMRKYFRRPDSTQMRQINQTRHATVSVREQPIVIQMSSVRKNLLSPRRQAWVVNNNNNKNNNNDWSLMRQPLSLLQIIRDKFRGTRQAESGSPTLTRVRKFGTSFLETRQESRLQKVDEPWVVKCYRLESSSNTPKDKGESQSSAPGCGEPSNKIDEHIQGYVESVLREKEQKLPVHGIRHDEDIDTVSELDVPQRITSAHQFLPENYLIHHSSRDNDNVSSTYGVSRHKTCTSRPTYTDIPEEQSFHITCALCKNKSLPNSPTLHESDHNDGQNTVECKLKTEQFTKVGLRHYSANVKDSFQGQKMTSIGLSTLVDRQLTGPEEVTKGNGKHVFLHKNIEQENKGVQIGERMNHTYKVLDIQVKPYSDREELVSGKHASVGQHLVPQEKMPDESSHLVAESTYEDNELRNVRSNAPLPAGPVSLEDMATQSYTKMFIQDAACKTLPTESRTTRADLVSVNQPSCLAILSSQTLLTENLTNNHQSKSSVKYKSASTGRGSSKLTYL